ncbi:MAG: rubredoxin [Candidatus Brocadiia bacterium]|jgi:rubredoxin|nr:rubredoxin [Candidatus Brocadiia bacterium]
MEEPVCSICGYVYRPEIGDPKNGVEAGIAFVDLPDGWVCPICGASVDVFFPEEQAGH